MSFNAKMILSYCRDSKPRLCMLLWMSTLIGNGGAAIKVGGTGIASFNVRRDLASPGSEGTIADREIFKLEEFPLRPFETLSQLGGEFDGFVEAHPFFNLVRTASLGQGKNQRQPQTVDHVSSICISSGSLPPNGAPGLQKSEMRTWAGWSVLFPLCRVLRQRRDGLVERVWLFQVGQVCVGNLMGHELGIGGRDCLSPLFGTSG